MVLLNDLLAILGSKFLKFVLELGFGCKDRGLTCQYGPEQLKLLLNTDRRLERCASRGRSCPCRLCISPTVLQSPSSIRSQRPSIFPNV